MFHPTNKIHPTAIIGEKVKIGQYNEIGANVVIEGKVTLGDYNKISTGVIFSNKAKVGNHNQFFPYVTIGFQGEMGSKGDIIPEKGIVKIGNNNVIREYVNVHFPVRTNMTSIGNYNYIMNKVYIAHDVKIHDKVILTAGVLLAGRSEVRSYANLGMGAAIHQRSCVGEFAMVGMNAVITSDILPFSVVIGAPARILKFNKFGAERGDFVKEEVDYTAEHFPQIIANNCSQANELIKRIQVFKNEFPNYLSKFY